MQLLNNNGTPCTASEMRHTLYSGDVYAGGGESYTSRSRIESKLGGAGDRFW